MAKNKKKKKNTSSDDVVADVTGSTTKIKQKNGKKKQDTDVESKKSTKTAKKKKVAQKDSSESQIKETKATRVSGKSVRLSLRIAKKVTSITLDPTIVGLWLLFCTDDDPSDYKLIKGRINEFVYANLSTWEREDGKGLSEYITNRMMKACLDQKDFKLYRKFVKCLSGVEE